MEQRESTAVPSDDEHFEDANEKEVNDFKVNFSKQSVDGDENLDEHENVEEESFQDCEANDLIDDESQKDFEKDQTEEEREKARLKAIELKEKGNDEFRKGNFEKSAEIYTTALRECPVACASERSVLYGNRAMSKMKLDLKSAAIDDCSKAIEFNPNYLKVLLRRANLYESTDKLDECFEDFKKVLELDPGNHEARAAQIRLPPLINERNEKMKAEMIDKLKDLGNMVLRPFGLSTKNFEMKQDPSTGSYSVNFNQNPN